MAYNLGPSTGGGNSGGGGSSGTSGKYYGRVVDVIQSADHPEYQQYGESNSINGVFFRNLNTPKTEDVEEDLKFAYYSGNNFKQIPLKGEVVELVSQPATERTIANSSKLYWTKIIPIWNHVHHNAYPDTLQFEDQESQADLGEDFEESDKINNLQLFAGDVTVEGRHGNTLRFGGTKHDLNEITDDSNNGKPFTLLRNGQAEAGDAFELVIENINDDDSSLYMTSDHIIELEQAHEKRDGFEEEPEKADTFKGAQVLINSGRLYFNARDEGAFISAKESIGLNAKVIGIDSDDYIGMDSKKIYLGTGAFDEDEPALKGETTTVWLDDLVSLLEGLAKTMATTPPAPPTYIAGLLKEGVKMQAQLPALKQLLKNLHSKKVFIDKI